MRNNKYLFTHNDIRSHLSSLTQDTVPVPLLKPGKSSWPPASNKCLSWNDVKNWLLWVAGYSESQMPTWDDMLAEQGHHATTGTMYGTDSWGGAWTTWYLSLYTTNPPHSSRARNINLGVGPGQAAAITRYKIDGNWWAGSGSNWKWVCKHKSSGAYVYGCFNETRPGNTNCSTNSHTTYGDIYRSSGSTSPKGCILALVPYGNWIEEIFIADNVGGTSGRVDYLFEWFVIPWPY